MKDTGAKVSNEAGFSLVELIVALAILSLLAALLLRAVESSRGLLMHMTHMRTIEQPMAIQQAIRRLISEVRPHKATPANARPALVGSREAVRFTSSYAPAGSPWGLTEYRIELAPPDSHSNARRLYLAYRPAGAPDGTWSSVPLIEQVAQVSISYRASGDATAQWRSEWTAIAPPRLIAIDVADTATPSRAWPTMRFALPLAAQAE